MRQINRDVFFTLFRKNYGIIRTQSQVEGLNFLLDSMENDPHLTDYRHGAYMLATTDRETGGTYQPAKENLNYSAKALIATWPKRFTPQKAAELAKRPEAIANYVYGGRNGNGPESSGDGWLFCGRGFVQITGRGNYQALGKVIGVDLVGNPELACIPRNAYAIMSYGMRKGYFTGKCLKDYIDGECNYYSARKIINGLDHAEEIANVAVKFERILVEAMT